MIKKIFKSDAGLYNAENRHQWIRSQLKSLEAGLKILDVGAGSMPYKKDCEHLKYESQDFGAYDPKKSEKGYHNEGFAYGDLDYVCDIAEIPVPDNAYDAVLCSEVFEHIPSPESALKEISRILKPDGVLLLTSPFASLTHFAPYHFYSGFNRYFYEHFAKSFGFEIEELKANGSYFDFLAQELRYSFQVTDKYIREKPSIWERLLVKLLLKIYDRKIAKDQGSDELLCFSYFLRAKKK